MDPGALEARCRRARRRYEGVELLKACRRGGMEVWSSGVALQV